MTGLTRRAAIVSLGGAVLIGAGVAWTKHGASSANAQGAAQTLTPAQARDAVAAGQIVLVDVRRPDEWARTGIAAGAVPIDMRRPDFAQAVADARGALPVALICARGVRTRHMTDLLRAAGMDDVIDIPEGMLGGRAGPGWIAAGLPLVAWSP